MRLLVVAFFATACAVAAPAEIPEGQPDAGGVPISAPRSRDRTPNLEADYYVEQGLRYFDALDLSAPQDSLPTYARQVARWEWPPWLLLTGFGAEQMEELDRLVKRVTPATIAERDCRFFGEQPFARCRVVFEYEEGPCPIYEEFTFNDAGEITFIEAWSDLPGHLPMDAELDPWAEGQNVHRLSTRVPGLGFPDGAIDLQGAAMLEAARMDGDIDSFVRRAESFWFYWLAAYKQAGASLFRQGCGW